MNLQLHCELGIVVMQNSTLYQVTPLFAPSTGNQFSKSITKTKSNYFLFPSICRMCVPLSSYSSTYASVWASVHVYRDVWSWSTSQMPSSKGWLFLAFSALLTHIQYMACMNRTETKCVPAYGRSGYKAVQIFFFGEVTGLNQKLNFNTVACEDFASGAWFPPFYNEAVLDSPAEAVMLKQPPTSACFA